MDDIENEAGCFKFIATIDLGEKPALIADLRWCNQFYAADRRGLNIDAHLGGSRGWINETARISHNRCLTRNHFLVNNGAERRPLDLLGHPQHSFRDLCIRSEPGGLMDAVPA
ncbi:MAG TPA: hypothetical protein VF975_07690, partial [Thermoanaerobaculia bacterium]